MPTFTWLKVDAPIYRDFEGALISVAALHSPPLEVRRLLMLLLDYACSDPHTAAQDAAALAQSRRPQREWPAVVRRG